MAPSHRWIRGRVARVRALSRGRRVRFTLKALEEISEAGFGLKPDDAVELLSGLTESDFSRSLRSEATGEALLVFKPLLLGVRMYVKMVVRTECVVISFHADTLPDENPQTT